MPPTSTPLSHEETVALIEQRVKDTDLDEFSIQVFRRGMTFVQVAGLSAAKLEHITRPEGWLPQLCGGGVVFLKVFHAGNVSAPIGGFLQYSFKGDPKEIDPNMVDQPFWTGPKKIVFPDRGSVPSSSDGLGRRSAVERHAAAEPIGGFSGSGPEIERLRRELEYERRQRDEDRHRAEEERNRREREQERKDNELRFQMMEQKFLSELKELRAGNARPADDGVIKYLPALVPVFTSFVEGMNQMRLESLKQQQSLATAQSDLTKAMLNRPAIDPGMEKLLDKVERAIEASREDAGGASETLEAMTGAMHTMTKIAMQSATAVAEANMGKGGEDSTTMKAFREGMKALENIFSALGKSRGVGPGGQAGSQAGRQLPPVNGQHATADEITQIVDAIKQLRKPHEVAAVIVKLAKEENPTFVKAMAEVSNNLNELAVQKLGAEWMLANPGYVRELMDAIQKLGTKEGVFRAEGQAAGNTADENGKEGTENTENGDEGVTQH